VANPDTLPLRDIKLPDPVSWWPLAPGWYLLFILILVLISGLIISIYRHYKKQQPKREALVLLKAYKKEYESNNDSVKGAMAIGELLRRVALVYYPRETVASLHGDDWITFLNKTAKNIDFKPLASLLLELPFKNKYDVDINPLFVKAESWIKQRKKPCLN
jgi:hypothetical protein